MLGKRTAPALSNVATLAILAAAIVVAWVVIGFTRVSLAGARDVPVSAVSATRTDLQTTSGNPSLARSTVLSKREAIVYVINGDTTFYHSPVHAMHEAQRQAVALPVARARGLVPCPVCFRAANR